MSIGVNVTNNIAERINAQATELKHKIHEGVQVFAARLLDELVTQTPILTGQARANWQVGIGGVPTSYLPSGADIHLPNRVDYAGTLSAGESAIRSYDGQEPIFIVNNAPYIELLNEGSSKQAPAGFIEAAVSVAFGELQSLFRS